VPLGCGACLVAAWYVWDNWKRERLPTDSYSLPFGRLATEDHYQNDLVSSPEGYTVHIEALGLVLVGLPFAQPAMRVRRSRESDTAIHILLQSHILEKPGNWAAELHPQWANCSQRKEHSVSKLLFSVGIGVLKLGLPCKTMFRAKNYVLLLREITVSKEAKA